MSMKKISPLKAKINIENDTNQISIYQNTTSILNILASTNLEKQHQA